MDKILKTQHQLIDNPWYQWWEDTVSMAGSFHVNWARPCNPPYLILMKLLLAVFLLITN